MSGDIKGMEKGTGIKMLVKKLQLLTFMLLAAIALRAQTTTQPANPGSESTQSTVAQPAQTDSESTQPATTQPAHPGEVGPQLTVESDPEYKNVLVGNVMGSASFDDHALVSQRTPGTYTSDTRFALQPSFAFQQTRQNASWTLSYTPGVSISQHDLNDYQYTQNAGAELTLQSSSRFRVRLRQDYTVTTNPFESVGREPVLPTLGGFTGPTSNDLLPDTKREMMVSNAEVMTRLSPHSALGFTGGYQKFSFSNIPGTADQLTLSSSHTYLGTAFYSLQVSQRMTIGAQAAVFDMFSDFQAGSGARTQAYDAQLFDAWQLTARSVLTIYAGPEYSRDNEPDLPLALHWRPEGGATYAWNGARNAVTLDYVRRISDSGGVVGSALTNHGVAAVRSRLSKSWGVEGHFDATDQLAEQGLIDFRSFWAGAAVTRDLGRNLLFRLDYARVRQTVHESAAIPLDLSQFLSPSFPTGNHNLVQFSVDYHFMKPVGR